MGITKKQKEVYDYIVSYTRKNGYAPTQREIKEHFNLKSFGSVQRYMKYLTDAGYLSNDWNARRGISILKSEENKTTMDIPLLGLVAAGNPIEAIEQPETTISVPLHFIKPGNKYYGLTVKGDSMIEDGILEDDVVVIKYQETANQGQTIVAVVEGEATLKKYFKTSNQIELHPANSNMSPIIVNSGHFKISGVLVGLIRSYL